MRVISMLGVVAAALIAFLGQANSLAAQDGPLFASHDLVELTIQAPFRDIFEHRGQDSEEYSGVVVMGRESGEAHTVDVDIRTRGRTRLEKRICRFPPLRLDFPKDSVAGTLFEGQNKLKLVTHCQDDREEYEQYVLLEYLTYRIYNTLTELSFRARLARITYEDSEGDRDTVTRYGFIIEHEETVAERTGWTYIAAPGIPARMYDPENLAQAEVFHYLIGNTDYSAVQADPGSSECCHNTKPIGGPAGPVFTVPHDFDMAGLLNTRYANRLYRTNLQRMGLRSVRQRRFRGLCQSEPLWPVVFATFIEHRSEIEGLFRDQEGLDEDVLEETLEYIEEFYEVINDEGKVRGEFERRCR